ncbi:MAG TPA: TIGR02281 family clan AA aspartic protease [Rhizomicrobium sp.]|nr:TIGR02281 family clan AA aspartic protease [Rhizomicrobium sp.]
MMRTNRPWNDDPREPAPPPSRVGVWLWVAFVVGGGLLLWELSRMFPGAINSDDNSDVFLARNVAILALVSGGILRIREFNIRETVRNFALWMGIAAVLLLGYTYQDELFGIGQRVRGELIPSYAVESGGDFVITESDGGDYQVTGSVNGQPVTFVVDTGASDVVLSPADAQRLGIDPTTLRFDRAYETANGTGLGAQMTVANLTVGPITLNDMKVSVNQAPMRTSLLGMSFLRRLKSFEFRDRRLYLRGK